MKSTPSPSVKSRGKTSKDKPIVRKLGGIEVKIYSTTNRTYHNDPVTGERILKSAFPQFTLTYYQGTQRKKQKFTDRERAIQEADAILIQLANGDTEALKLKGIDRAHYVAACQTLSALPEPVNLQKAVSDYAHAIQRLPRDVSLDRCVEFFLKRHPSGLAERQVSEVVKELLEAKRGAGKGDRYLVDIQQRLGAFARAFQVPIASIHGEQLDKYIRDLKVGPRSKNNVRRLIITLFKFAIRRGYLPKDHDEASTMEMATVPDTEIEIFTPGELRQFLAVVREEMLPFLLIGAFSGMRTAELSRLDWSEVHLEDRFIEVKAKKAKTASRRLAHIPENLARWLEPLVQPSGPVVTLKRFDKELYQVLARQTGIPWKQNGLRHSFISYRLAETQNMAQVALEAGNSAAMIFKHYRQIVTPAQSKEWFGILPTGP